MGAVTGTIKSRCHRIHAYPTTAQIVEMKQVMGELSKGYYSMNHRKIVGKLAKGMHVGIQLVAFGKEGQAPDRVLSLNTMLVERVGNYKEFGLVLGLSPGTAEFFHERYRLCFIKPGKPDFSLGKIATREEHHV